MARSTRSRGALSDVIDAEASRSSITSPSTRVSDASASICSLVCSASPLVEPAGEQLDAGVQHRQRGAKFVRCVGDETSLQGQRLGERADRPSGEQTDHGNGGQDPGQFGDTQR